MRFLGKIQERVKRQEPWHQKLETLKTGQWKLKFQWVELLKLNHDVKVRHSRSDVLACQWDMLKNGGKVNQIQWNQGIVHHRRACQLDENEILTIHQNKSLFNILWAQLDFPKQIVQYIYFSSSFTLMIYSWLYESASHFLPFHCHRFLLCTCFSTMFNVQIPVSLWVWWKWLCNILALHDMKHLTGNSNCMLSDLIDLPFF
jgi:hypothetical protein